MENENTPEVSAASKGGKNKVVAVVIILIVILVAGYFVMKKGGVTGASTASVATVNGVPILKSAFDTQLASAIASYQAQGINATSTDQLAQIKNQVLDNLINNEVLNQAVKAAGIVTSSADVEKQYQALLTQAGGADKLQAEMVQSKITEAQLRTNIAQQLAIQTYLLQNINVNSITASDAEIAQFYAQYSAAQKASGQTVPALATLSAQIKQQIISNKEQTLATQFIAALRAKATIATSTSAL